MVCNWNHTQYELEKKKVEPTQTWDDDNNVDATSTTDLCTNRVSYDVIIKVPCGEGVCEKTVTKYRTVSGPCWNVALQDQSLNLGNFNSHVSLFNVAFIRSVI